MDNLLEKEFEYYIANQDELVKQHQGKFLVIKDEKVIGTYDSEVEAVQEASKEFELGTFMVIECQPGKESYTQTFHSRVVFA